MSMSDTEQGLPHRGTPKGRNNTLKLCSWCLRQRHKATRFFFFLRVLHKILNTCLMKSNKKFPPSFSLCNYVIWRQVCAFGSLLLIAQFEGNGFCLMAYATAYVCVHMHSFCFFSLLLVCVLCVTRHYLHTLFLISHFTRFLSSAGNRKMKKQAAAVDESEIEK